MQWEKCNTVKKKKKLLFTSYAYFYNINISKTFYESKCKYCDFEKAQL